MNDSTTAINPFATPTCVSEPASSEAAKNERASEAVLRRLCRRLMITDVCYTLGCVSYFATYFLFAISSDMQYYFILTCLPFAFFLITWVYLIIVNQTVQGAVAAIGVMITFPIPLLGSIVYRKEAVHANLFLYRNGYRRTFLGGEPEAEERQRMEADSTYVPSVYFDHQGEKRKRSTFTLGDATVVGMIGFFLMVMVMDFITLRS